MVSGEAGSGKDTFYRLAKKHYASARYAFADELKVIADRMGWDGEKDEKGRQLLIDLGTVGRKYDLSCWANLVADRIEMDYLGDVDFAIITDFRYPNEYKVLSERFGEDFIFTIRLMRPGYDNGLTPEQRADESETGLDGFKFDAWIINDDLERFDKKVEFMLGLIGETNGEVVCGSTKVEYQDQAQATPCH